MAWLLSFWTLICLFFLDNTYRQGKTAGEIGMECALLGWLGALCGHSLLFHGIIPADRSRQAA